MAVGPQFNQALRRMSQPPTFQIPTAWEHGQRGADAETEASSKNTYS